MREKKGKNRQNGWRFGLMAMIEMSVLPFYLGNSHHFEVMMR